MAENRFYVEGRVGTDPDFRTTTGGTSVCKFSFANTYSFKQGNEWKDRTTWFNVTIWGKKAEYAAATVKKGMALLVIGRVQVDEWEKDGVKNKAVCIVADDFKFLNYISSGKKQDTGSQGSSDNPPEPLAHFSDDDIPF